MEAVGYAGVPGLELDAGEGAVGEEEGVVGVFLDAGGVEGGLVRGDFEGARGEEGVGTLGCRGIRLLCSRRLGSAWGALESAE